MKSVWRYIFPVVFGLLIYATIRAVNDTTAGQKFWTRPWQVNAIETTSVIVVSYLLLSVLNYFIKKFSRDSNKPINSKTILKEFGTVFLANFIIMNCTVIPMAAFTDDGLQVSDIVIIHIIPALYVLLYFAIARGNYYLKSYVAQKVQLEKITNDQLQTELKFLKAQYHPHFLFNALNTIYFQVDEDTATAKKSIEKFSNLLRYQLYDQQQTVPVSREIEYLESFIALQKMRSSERLQLKVDFDKSLGGQQVYPLLFLPLVENAFKYVGGDMEIDIVAAQHNGHIHFKVENSIPTYYDSVKTGGIGLENLKRRLELLYPQRHELNIEQMGDRFLAELKLTGIIH